MFEPISDPAELETRVVAIAQGGRLARLAQVIATAQGRGLLDVCACCASPCW